MFHCFFLSLLVPNHKRTAASWCRIANISVSLDCFLIDTTRFHYLERLLVFSIFPNSIYFVILCQQALHSWRKFSILLLEGRSFLVYRSCEPPILILTPTSQYILLIKQIGQAQEEIYKEDSKMIHKVLKNIRLGLYIDRS